MEEYLKEFSKNNRELLNQEISIIRTTELVSKIMNDKNISRKVLAKGLKKDISYINKTIDGDRDFTIREISDIFTFLGYEFAPGIKKYK